MALSTIVGAFVLSLIGLAVLRLIGLARADLSARSGVMVMAIGIFARSAWYSLPCADDLSARPLALILVVAWAAVVASAIGSCVRGTFHRYVADPIDSFAVGT